MFSPIFKTAWFFWIRCRNFHILMWIAREGIPVWFSGAIKHSKICSFGISKKPGNVISISKKVYLPEKQENLCCRTTLTSMHLLVKVVKLNVCHGQRTSVSAGSCKENRKWQIFFLWTFAHIFACTDYFLLSK